MRGLTAAGDGTTFPPGSFALPWRAWHGDESFAWEFPADWTVEVLQGYAAPGLSDEAIGAALDAPLGTAPLAELAAGFRSAAIAVDDLARPTQAGRIVLPLLARLNRAGLPDEAIRVVVAVGTHGTLSPEQQQRKLGAEVCDRVAVEVHSAWGDLVDTDIPYGPLSLKINRTFWEAELKLAIGCALPHSFAGFSGGAKLVLPGLADVPATARSHQFVQMGLRGGADPDKNRFRTEIEELARRIGLRFAVTCLPNAARETAALFAGDVVEAHRGACNAAGTAYTATVTATTDVLWLNAYPKDIDLVQAETVMVALKSLPELPLSAGGLVLLSTAATEGLGRHGLFEPGGANYREPKPIRALKGRELWVFAPGVDEETFHRMYCRDYRWFADPAALRQALVERFAGPARITVVPTAPMQVLRDGRLAPAT